MKEEIFRNTCPRNCYGTCSLLSFVKNGKLVKVTGDPKQRYNKGKLCAKGYASTQFIDHPKRLKYPMLQQPRGSGDWKRITWDDAYTIIATKLVTLNKHYGSNLFAAYNRHLGNRGMLHHAVEGMFNSIGPHSKPIGNFCSESGKTVMKEFLGFAESPDPENMENAKLIVIWGANPAVTNVHQMKFIYEARRRGAVFVVIDPLFTKTAEKADIYIQIKPDTDHWLALGVAKLLIEGNTFSSNFVNKYPEGWEEYKTIINSLNFTTIFEKTAVTFETIQELAQLYASNKPVATWIGLGLQRSTHATEIISSILTLTAISGNLLHPNGGVYYVHNALKDFPNHLSNHAGPAHPIIKDSRKIDITNFASEALSFHDPPVKFLWIASMNPLSQDHHFAAWKQLIKQLDLFVTVDLFMTKTTEQADLVLPAATHFEEEDLLISYWHHWLSLNQKAVPNFYETKSDLQIAREITRRLNQLSPGFSNFPAEKEPLDWIKEELPPKVMELYSISSYKDLLDGPSKRRGNFPIIEENLQFRYYSHQNLEGDAKKSKKTKEPCHNYRLLSPQSLLMIHSQFGQLSWLKPREEELVFEISEEAAKQQKISQNDWVDIYTNSGSVTAKIKINPYLPIDVVLTNQAGHHPINQIITLEKNKKPYQYSTRFYDTFIKIRARRDLNV